MRADRLLSLLLLLQTHGRMSARVLAERLEVCERTVYRDLDALSATGVPITIERGRHGGCSLLPGYRTELTGLTAGEVRTLFVARAVSHLADLGLDVAADTALLKLLAALPAISRADAERALARIHLDADVWFHTVESVPHLSTVQEAVWQERRLQIDYRHCSGKTTTMVVEPLGLVAKARVWYLVAAVAGAIRVFRVARIEEATLLDDQFTRPDGFDLRDFWTSWRDSFERSIPRYPVVVRVAPEAMPRLQGLLGEEVDIHLEQAAPPDALGRCIVPVAFERPDDACRALLGCGGLVEAVEPQDLRAAIAAAAVRVDALHGS